MRCLIVAFLVSTGLLILLEPQEPLEPQNRPLSRQPDVRPQASPIHAPVRRTEVAFIRNVGQWRDEVEYRLESARHTMWLTRTGVLFQSVVAAAAEASEAPTSRTERDALAFAEELIEPSPAMKLEGLNCPWQKAAFHASSGSLMGGSLGMLA
jgi:hypothetical protein